MPACAPADRGRRTRDRGTRGRGTTVGDSGRGDARGRPRPACRGSDRRERTATRGSNTGCRRPRPCRSTASCRDDSSEGERDRPRRGRSGTGSDPRRGFAPDVACRSRRGTGRTGASTGAAVHPPGCPPRPRRGSGPIRPPASRTRCLRRLQSRRPLAVVSEVTNRNGGGWPDGGRTRAIHLYAMAALVGPASGTTLVPTKPARLHHSANWAAV